MTAKSEPSAADGQRAPTLLSWSSGKDSLWALHTLTQAGSNVRGLLTSCNGENGRVAMHGVRRTVLDAQAHALGLPLTRVELPHPCSNADYEERMRSALAAARAEGIREVAFGDLFLTDVRAYRERQLDGTGLEPCFPIWGLDTRTLAREMIAAGLRAVITCVDPKQCPAELAGQPFDPELLARLPPNVDPCGENGEFHTCVYDGPGFAQPIELRAGEIVEREGFVFADFMTARDAAS